MQIFTENPPLRELNFRPTLFWSAVGFSVVTVLIVCTIFYLAQSPKSYPNDSSITIRPGSSLSAIVSLLDEENYVRSANLLHAYIVYKYPDSKIQAGTYFFPESLNVTELTKHIFEIGPEEEFIVLTFPEGISVKQLALIAERELLNFEIESFLEKAIEFEGSMFPDTYFVPETYSDLELFDLLQETYQEKISEISEQIENHSLTEYEILTLASIIEREANSVESMRMVSGILQNRLDIDMVLQADASMEYVLNKPLSELLASDLKIDSPYNTYLYRGLPPTPIGNPGLDAILAVLNPTQSNNFYYITDDNGDFHYAQTYANHRSNITRYLR